MDRERGAILMFVVVLSSVLVGLTASYSASVRTQAVGAMEDGHGLKAELAAESGMDYARRQLILNSSWRGTDPGGIDLGDGSSFDVTVTETTSNQGNLEIVSEGSHDEGFAKLHAYATLGGGGGNSDKAIIYLGAEWKMHHVYGWGDVVLTDQLGVVKDWVVDGNGQGSWVPGGATALVDFQFHHTDLYGKLYKYSETPYLGPPASEETISEWQFMPAWDLDSYLVPRAGLTIVENSTFIKNVNTEDTLVIVADPGVQVKLKNCYIGGGVVFWAPNDFETRGPARNSLKIMSGCVIGGGGQGAEATLGILAPAAELHAASNTAPDLTGFSLWHSVKSWSHSNIWGQTWIINRAWNIMHTCFWYDANIALNPPTGITVGGNLPSIDIGQMSESFH